MTLILDDHGIVLSGVEVCELVFVIAFHVRHSRVDLRNATPLSLPVVGLVLLAGERALLAFEPFSVSREVKSSYRTSVRVVNEVKYAEVESHSILSVDVFSIRFLGFFGLDTE